MFENVVNDIKSKLAERDRQKKADQAMIHQMDVQAKQIERQEFQTAYRANAKKVAIASANKRAAESTGYQKLVAMNRARHLATNNQAPGGAFEKLKNYTQANLAKREENIKATEQRRIDAKKVKDERESSMKRDREDRLLKSQTRRLAPLNTRKPFG